MDYINDFIEIKQLTENLWEKKKPDRIYGYQFQQKTKWKKGLSGDEIAAFEDIMGFAFPDILRDYYSIMNGVDKESVNIYGESGVEYKYSKVLYSYPEDINMINELIQFVYDENNINPQTMRGMNVSRIFPIYGHCFMLIDHPEHLILMMHGKNIQYYSKSLVDMFYRELARRGERGKNRGIGYGWIEN
ncbi:hypothetical protein FACS1894137_20000 [Spirochaetia bacterium]|nr:hypothetical protein FACS1894137_20000 [Spirochaetia bacterium]